MFHYYVFVCILPGKAVPEMTYTVSGGMLNPTHSLTHAYILGCSCWLSSLFCSVSMSHSSNRASTAVLVAWLAIELSVHRAM